MTEPQRANSAAPAAPASAATEPAAAPTATVTRTEWLSSGRTPLRQFLRAETGSAAILAAATLAALVWSNVAPGSYGTLWSTQLSVHVAGHGIQMDLRQFVNSGLMTLFFLVVGLEARREFDMGELRVRSRLALPSMAGLGGMLVPIAIYLAINAGRSTAHGWGAAMSTDTAFALGALALVGGRRLPDRVRTYLLTFSVVDDLLGLAVIAIFYSSHVRWAALLIGGALLAVDGVLIRRGVRNGPLYLLLGVAAWVAFWQSGVDPIVAGLVIGLLTCAYPAARADLEQATDAFRLFREQPTARLAAEAREVVRGAISPNERLQERYHSWTSYVIVPLFALANADIKISGSFLAHAYTSPATLGIMIGYIVGKPIGTAGGGLAGEQGDQGPADSPGRLGRGRRRGRGRRDRVHGLAADRLARLHRHRAGRGQARHPFRRDLRHRAHLGDLPRPDRLSPQEPAAGAVRHRDDRHRPGGAGRPGARPYPRAGKDALVTLVEYGDFECPYCGQAEPAVRELLRGQAELRFVFRHLPLTEVHPHAQLAAEGAESAAKQGAFWEMHDMLMDHQGALTARDLIGYAADLGLDTEKFAADLRKHTGAAQIAEDVDSADLAAVSGTPTFFINGNRYYGAFDLEALQEAVRTAKGRAVLNAR